MVTPVAMEPLLGYHPCSTGFLTSSRDPAGDNVRWGVDQAVASERGYRRRLLFPSEWSETIRRVQSRELDCDTDGWGRYESRT